MASFTKRALEARDDDDLPFGWVEEDGQTIPWWYSRDGIIVKWTLFWTVTLVFLVWIVGGYMHAKRRIKKGLPPLKYHRWMVSRQDRARVDPNYAFPQATYANYHPAPNGYPMYNMPPPVYDPSRPPMYEGPENGSKIDPTQGRTQPTQQAPQTNQEPDYEAPLGPPPASTR